MVVPVTHTGVVMAVSAVAAAVAHIMVLAELVTWA